MRVTALTRVTAPRVATVLTVVAAEPEDELPVPLSEIVVAARHGGVSARHRPSHPSISATRN